MYVCVCVHVQETGSVLSFSQDLLNVTELMSVLADPEMALTIKHTYLSFLLAVHLVPQSSTQLSAIIHQP